MSRKGPSKFEKYLTFWVFLCIIARIAIGKLAPKTAAFLDSLSIKVNGAPVISIPIAIYLFFMMFPIMVKIDCASVIKTDKSPKPVGLPLFANWTVKPFIMFLIAYFSIGILFRNFIGTDTGGLVKLPPGADWAVGSINGAGKVALENGLELTK